MSATPPPDVFKRWDMLMAALKFERHAEVYSLLFREYAGEDRFYHALAHIMEGLDVLDRLDADPITKLAFWWHDARYNVTIHTNETDSGLWMMDKMHSDSGIQHRGIAVLREAFRLIELTKHHDVEAFDVRGCHMVVADLYRLGGDAETYARNTFLIRREYGQYSHAEWIAGRRAFIGSMLGRMSIFPPGRGYRELELAAYGNLRAELSALDSVMA